jgi:4-aminobutyrate aminotransferase-like enzyme
MKQILALNAFNQNAAGLKEPLQSRVQQRIKAFGAASVLFYAEPIDFVRGKGCWLYDTDGEAYLDVYNNVPSVGHCHPHVAEAANCQLRQLNTHTRYLNRVVDDYAARLLATFPAALANITFTCTGSESNDLALRLATKFTGGQGFIVTRTAYHGNTAAVTEVSPSSFKDGYVPAHVRLIEAPDTYRIPAHEIAPHMTGQVEAAIAGLKQDGFGFAGMIADSIFSSDGVYADPEGFLAPVVEAIHRGGGLYIADEVQPGFGRTGAGLWGFSRHGITPDIVTMGKPMGNGYPMGAVVTRPEILAAFCKDIGYFNTFGGSPVAAATGAAVLDVIEREDLIANAGRVGNYLRQALRTLALKHPTIGDVRGAGLFTGVEMIVPGSDKTPAPDAASRIINGLKQHHVLIGAAGPYGSTLKVRPPLCFSKENADLLTRSLEAVLDELEL